MKAHDGGLVFHFLGREVRFPDGVVNWNSPGPGAKHQLWRMNLAYMEYLEGVDDPTFINLIDQWIAANDVIHPGAWRDHWNSYALSTRLVVWLQQFAVRRRRLPSDFTDRAAESAARQAWWLSRHLETDVRGNHLIRNIKALLWSAAAFEGAQSIKWERQAVDLLKREIRAQVLADGVHYERSPSYHCQCLADLVECRSVLSGPLPELDHALEKMAQAAIDLAHPDGLVAQFNDSGLNMARTPRDCLDALASQGFGRPKSRRNFGFASAGYFGWRTPQWTLLADCGAIAPDALPAHGHADVLSFELSAFGERVFIDQGVFEYIEGEKRELSRAARSHNTLWIEGADQAEFFGSFRMGRRPNEISARWRAEEDRFELDGRHDGFAYLPGRPIHHRQIKASSEEIEIVDWLVGQRPQPASLGFLLHPNITARSDSDGSVSLLLAGVRSLRIRSNERLTLEPAHWWPDMGVEVATARILARSEDARNPIKTTIVSEPRDCRD